MSENRKEGLRIGNPFKSDIDVGILTKLRRFDNRPPLKDAGGTVGVSNKPNYSICVSLRPAVKLRQGRTPRFSAPVEKAPHVIGPGCHMERILQHQCEHKRCGGDQER